MNEEDERLEAEADSEVEEMETLVQDTLSRLVRMAERTTDRTDNVERALMTIGLFVILFTKQLSEAASDLQSKLLAQDREQEERKKGGEI